MDIKAKVEEIVSRLRSDKSLMARFQSEPVKAVEELLGCDLPDDQISAIVDAVKAKLGADKLSGVLGGLFGR